MPPLVHKTHNQTRAAIWIVISLVLLVAGIMLLDNAGVFQPGAGTHRITFRVTAAGGYANVTLKAGEVHIDKSQTLTTPWERTYDIEDGQTVFLTASNPTQTGELSCFILLDHSDWKRASTVAPKDGVACAGIIP
jgi:hypothetical protein